MPSGRKCLVLRPLRDELQSSRETYAAVLFALAAGISGAIASTHIVVTAGLAEVAAGSTRWDSAVFSRPKAALSATKVNSSEPSSYPKATVTRLEGYGARFLVRLKLCEEGRKEARQTTRQRERRRQRSRSRERGSLKPYDLVPLEHGVLSLHLFRLITPLKPAQMPCDA